MALILLIISNFYRLFFIGTVPSTLSTIDIVITPTFLSFFLVHWQDSSICFSFHFLLFLFRVQPERQNSLDGKFFFLFFLLTLVLVVWPRLSDPLYLKTPKNFMHLIFLEGFWFGHMLFAWMVKFQSLASESPPPIVPSTVFLSCKFDAFVYDVTNHFIYVPT